MKITEYLQFHDKGAGRVCQVIFVSPCYLGDTNSCILYYLFALLALKFPI
ncbi:MULTISPECIES: hypothetical protein [unclassified Wolbachia]